MSHFAGLSPRNIGDQIEPQHDDVARDSRLLQRRCQDRGGRAFGRDSGAGDALAARGKPVYHIL